MKLTSKGYSSQDFGLSLDKNLIAGGLGGLGRSKTHWMVCRGVRNLILLSRQGPDGNSRAKELIEELKEKGITVMAPRCDVTSADSFLSVLMDCGKEMPPIQGCILGSMVLKV